jgi:hypothetical protein
MDIKRTETADGFDVTYTYTCKGIGTADEHSAVRTVMLDPYKITSYADEIETDRLVTLARDEASNTTTYEVSLKFRR